MRNLLRNEFVFVTLAIALGACTPKGDNKPAQTCPGDLLAPVAPDSAAAAAGAIDLAALPEGTYALSEIRTFVEAQADGAKETGRGGFQHVIAKPGSPEKGDVTCKSYSGAQAAKDSAYLLNAELSIPFVIHSKSKEVTLDQVRYYWTQVRSDGGWAWKQNSAGYEGGTGFARALVTGSSKDGLASQSLANGKVSTRTRMVGTSLVVHANAVTSTGTKIIRLTYVPATVAPSAADSSEKTMVVGRLGFDVQSMPRSRYRSAGYPRAQLRDAKALYGSMDKTALTTNEALAIDRFDQALARLARRGLVVMKATCSEQTNKELGIISCGASGWDIDLAEQYAQRNTGFRRAEAVKLIEDLVFGAELYLNTARSELAKSKDKDDPKNPILARIQDVEQAKELATDFLKDVRSGRRTPHASPANLFVNDPEEGSGVQKAVPVEQDIPAVVQ